MKTRVLRIKEITFLTGKDEICISGQMQEDLLSYETCAYLSSTGLNKILNYLQLMNPDIDVCGSFLSNSDSDGHQFMYLDATAWISRSIPTELLYQPNIPMQIRA